MDAPTKVVVSGLLVIIPHVLAIALVITVAASDSREAAVTASVPVNIIPFYYKFLGAGA